MDKSWYAKLFSSVAKPAVQTTRTRAEAGDADAQFSLGLSCSNAPGAAQDLPQAAQWYRKAADQSHALAQFNLGVMFALGQGVPQDNTTAALWIRRAAESGDAGAQFKLGTRCHRASIDEQPPAASEARIEAFKWFQLAAAQGYKDSDVCRGRVTFEMTREDVVEGNRRAAGFVAAKFAGAAD